MVVKFTETIRAVASDYGSGKTLRVQGFSDGSIGFYFGDSYTAIEPEEAEAFIHAFARALDRDVTLAPKPVYLPTGIGAVIDSGWFKYVRIDKDWWQVIGGGQQVIGGRQQFTDAEMRDNKGGEPYEIISEGVEL